MLTAIEADSPWNPEEESPAGNFHARLSSQTRGRSHQLNSAIYTLYMHLFNFPHRTPQFPSSQYNCTGSWPFFACTHRMVHYSSPQSEGIQ